MTSLPVKSVCRDRNSIGRAKRNGLGWLMQAAPDKAQRGAIPRRRQPGIALRKDVAMKKLPTEYADLGEVRIAFCQHGSGPTLLLLHGNSESKRSFFQYQTRYFAEFHTLAIDSRGHGESRSDNTDFSIEQYANDVIGLCRKKGVDKASVIGYSDGGNIALFLACKAPEMFPRIIAISPNYLVEGTVDWALAVFRFLSGTMKMLGALGINTRKAIARFNLVLTDIGMTEADLRGIRTQVDILCAENDLIKEEHIKRIAELIPKSRLFKVGGCNHISILGKPKAIEIMRNLLLYPDAAGSTAEIVGAERPGAAQ